MHVLLHAIHGNSKSVKCELNIRDILGEKSQHQTSVPEFPVARKDRSGLAGVKVPFASCFSMQLCTNSALSGQIVCASQIKHTQDLCQDLCIGFELKQITGSGPDLKKLINKFLPQWLPLYFR